MEDTHGEKREQLCEGEGQGWPLGSPWALIARDLQILMFLIPYGQLYLCKYSGNKLLLEIT